MDTDMLHTATDTPDTHTVTPDTHTLMDTESRLVNLLEKNYTFPVTNNLLNKTFGI